MKASKLLLATGIATGAVIGTHYAYEAWAQAPEAQSQVYVPQGQFGFYTPNPPAAEAPATTPATIPETTLITVPPDTTEAPEDPPPGDSDRYMPYERDDGTIAGATGTYDYKGATVGEVYQMEHCGNNTDKVLLTFDDVGTYDHIREIVDVLKEKHVGAIFFPNTYQIGQDMFDELRNDGFWVGNHTYDHKNLVGMSDEGIAAEIRGGGEATLLRPPYGATYYNKEDGRYYVDSRVLAIAESLGKRICNWTLVTNDTEGPKTAEQIKETILSRVRPGDVILEHLMNNLNTLEALPDEIDEVRELGLEFCAPQSEPTSRDIPATLPC